MKQLRQYLNSLTTKQQIAFAKACGTSIGYLRKAICIDQQLGCALAIRIDRESGGAVPVEVLVPDADWAYVRSKAA